MILSTVGLKGGVGKTTTACNLVIFFMKKGYNVALIDVDVNNNISNWAAMREEVQPEAKKIEYFVLNNSKDFKREYDTIVEQYDVVIMDGRPAVNDMAGFMLSLADIAIFPTQASPLDMWTNDETNLDVFQAAKKINKDLKGYYLLNRIKPKTNIAYECRLELEGFADSVGIEVFDTELADRTVYAGAFTQGLGVIETNNYKARAEVIRLGNEICKIFNI